MTDRELLELAAKAIDQNIIGWSKDWHNEGCEVGHLVQDKLHGFYVEWNPLNYDGDAFRLAGKLGLIVHFATPNIGEDVHIQFFDIEISEPVGDDSLAAARRAIVLAAAEIGKELV